ncbi:hypothetical protein VPH35_139272 [Triticum aestivum]
MASTLSLEYTAPQLLPRHDMDGAALRICTDGQCFLFYVQVSSVRRTGGTYWACLDALSAAPLLSGGLDDTGRQLLGTASTLWRTVINGLCRRLLLDLCREHGVVPGRAPTLMALPSDAMLAILARLPDGKDLLRVESTCTELRRLVGGRERDRELWLPRYKALPGNTLWWSLRGGSDDDLLGTSWKEMYVWVTRQREHRFQIPRWLPSVQRIFPSSWLSIHHLPRDLPSERPDDVVTCLTRFGKITREGDRVLAVHLHHVCRLCVVHTPCRRGGWAIWSAARRPSTVTGNTTPPSPPFDGSSWRTMVVFFCNILPVARKISATFVMLQNFFSR